MAAAVSLLASSDASAAAMSRGWEEGGEKEEEEREREKTLSTGCGGVRQEVSADSGLQRGGRRCAGLQSNCQL